MRQSQHRPISLRRRSRHKSQIPTKLKLSGTRLLTSATFGIFDNWRDQDRKKFSERAAKILERALKPVVAVKRRGDLLELQLPDDDMRKSSIDRLEQADPADPAKNLEAPTEDPPRLFDPTQFE